MFRKIKRTVRNWWFCRTKRCEYFRHYLAYGPAELTHIGYHSAARLGGEHFKNCRHDGPGLCGICSRWEQRLRA